MRINYNLSAMLTNTHLLRNERNQQSAAERLASGLKINHAKDDPAGMAISNKMDVQIEGLRQASRNSSDGISVIETADSSLNEVTSIIQRMRELAVQAASDTNGLEDRESIQLEINSLVEEIDRVSRNTEFNKKVLLDGSLSRRAYTDNRNVVVTAIGDGVPTAEYGVTLKADARQAVLRGNVGDPSAAFDADGKITAAAAGQVNINGVLIEIKEGDSKEMVYQKLRDGAELADVICIATENGTPLFDGTFEKTAGYEATAGLYDPSSNMLVFISKDYGSAEKTDIFINNALLAEGIGLGNDMYSAGTSVTAAEIRGVRGSTILLPDKTDPEELSPFLDKRDTLTSDLEGYIEIANVGGSGARVTLSHYVEDGETKYKATVNVGAGAYTKDYPLEVGSTANSIYEALKDACDHIDVDVSLTYEENSATYSTTDDLYSYGQAIVFKQRNVNGQLTLDVSNKFLARTMGLNTTTASVEGTDADAEFTLDGGKRVGYANSASISSKGEKVSVTDKNGFELEMTVNKKICATRFSDVTINNVNTTKHATAGTSTTKDVLADVTGIGMMTVHVGANEDQIMEIDIPEISAKTLEIDELNLRSGFGADKALVSLDAALARVAKVRSKLGAYQNRLEHTVASLNAADEDLTSAVSRIRDVDMAAETTEYTQHTILVQAATSVLAQANDLPQQALQLIQ